MRIESHDNYRGRRARKQVETYVDDPNDPNDGSWEDTADILYVYNGGWLLLLELDGLDDNSIMRKYTWGLDLSNSLEGAGGIGGLLAQQDPDDPNDPNDTAGDYVYTYDANGNVGQLLDVTTWDPNDPNTAIAAHYEYDPYGNRVNYDPNE
ncbi:MAG: hypothetical protein JXO22_06185, partial [Phycisphaerae bacterium]|nr:hypothetical protein [Phycisphaerae bacterium]